MIHLLAWTVSRDLLLLLWSVLRVLLLAWIVSRILILLAWGILRVLLF